MAKHEVKCPICGKIFDTNEEPFIKINNRRYAHQYCAENKEKLLSQEEQNKEKFYQTVKSIFGPKYNYVMINRQATEYIKQYNYTWSGMTACLHWFYNINHGSIEEGHGGVGIIPFIYDQVKEYYKRIYDSREKNKEIGGRGQVIEFNIQSPRALKQPPHLLDLEEQ